LTRPIVGIVGLGLVGGSLARALTRAGHCVVGVDDQAVARRARRAGAVAHVATLDETARGADLLVLAAPPRANLALLRRVAARRPRGLVVTDVTSVKAPICREARRLGFDSFVGGHPMAGTESSGFQASNPDLFAGRPWILVPDGAPPRALTRVRSLVRAVGAKPVEMEAAEHDRAVAYLSHVPQVIAWALLEAAIRDTVASRHLDVAGPAFREMTRLARSPRPLWREILGDNRAEVTRALRSIAAGLERARRRL
jgi:prephenate dehydrogenase